MGKKRKVLSSLVFGLMLCAPAVGVHAAEYTTPFLGGGDAADIYTDIRKDGDKAGEYIYSPGEDSTLNISAEGTSGDYSKNAYGIVIKEGKTGDTNKITVSDKLNISVEGNGGNNAAGIFISGSAEKVIDRKSGGDISVTETDMNSTNAFGVKVGDQNGDRQNQVFIGNGNLNITAKGGESSSSVYSRGLFAQYVENQIYMGTGKITSHAEKSTEDGSKSQVVATGITVYDTSKVYTEAIDIEATATGNASVEQTLVNGVEANWGGRVETGTGFIYASASGGENVYANGIYAYGGEIEKTGGNIKAVAEGEGTLQACGVVNNEGGIVNITGSTDVTAQTIGSQNAYSMGLYGAGDGTINYAGGTITASADNEDAYVAAVHAQNDATININKGTNNTVVINGDVNNNADGDGKVYLNLNTADSVLNGRVSDKNGIFNLKNGAQWNVLGKSTVNTFRMKNGIINMDRNYDVNIASYFGSGTIFFLAEDVGTDGVMTVNTGDITITSAASGSAITLSAAGNAIDTLDSAKAEKNLNALANKTYYDDNDENLIGKVVIQEGLITPEARGDLLFDANDRGYVANMTRGSRMTKTMNAMKNLEAAAIVSWRQEDSTLSQRLGDLRETTGGQGIWARVSRGEFEYSGEFKNQYNYFQIGWDMAKDDWHYGAAVSYNDGETTYANGNGENSSTSLSLYGTRLLNDGQYFDIVLKAGRLNNKYDNYAAAGHTHGDYDAWGTEISGEYGKKIDLANDWFVTPQAQLSLMRIGSEDYTTSNGIHVDQDTLYSAVGRIGAEAGKKTAWGSLYAKASVLHDFAGDADTYLTYGELSNSYSQDIGDTWYEAGFGANWKMSDSSYLYVDVIRTFGGDIKTPWQWNAGVRWGF